MYKTAFQFYSILLFIGIQFTGFSQENFVRNISPHHEKRIDSLFNEWNDPSKPGVIMALLNNNELVYLKSFGSTQLETSKPILRDTRFQLAAMSKHFTAFGILLLEEKGKLSLEDDARNIIKQLSHFNHPIRIIDLLGQSDGIFDFNALKYISGRSDEIKISNQLVLDMVERQKELSFIPGTDFVDAGTSTSILLLAEIIKEVSGKSFADFMREEVFAPIGMKNTLFIESKDSHLTNIANPYIKVDDGFADGEIFDDNYGVTNLFSTIEDLVKWELNMLNPVVGSRALYEKLNAEVILENGRKFAVPQGQLTHGQQYIHMERDLSSTYHLGQYGGYASSMFKFPKPGFISIVLSNNGDDYNGYLGVISSHILLEDVYEEPTVLKAEALPIQPISNQDLEALTGEYWDERGGLYRTIRLKNDTLQYVRNSGYASALYHIGNRRFQMLTGFDDKIFLTFKGEGDSKSMCYEGGGSEQIVFEKFEFKEEVGQWYEAYVGAYYSDLLQVGYSIDYEDGALTIKNLHTAKVKLIRIKDELFNGNQWFMRSIEFQKDDASNVIGFKTRMQEVDGVQFKKVR
ncbi:MAG: serine hydrolase domain-containing protein [Bacteroidota bacterium]